MSTWGLTSTGFLGKPVAQIVTDINNSVLNAVSPNLDLSATSALGQVIGIVASAIGEAWNLAQAVYSAYDPNQASGDQLAALALVTGTVKRGATYSYLPALSATVNLNAGVTLPAGSLASVANNPSAVFASVVAVTNSGGSAASIPCAFQAVTAGPIACPAGQLSVIAQSFAGWNSVSSSAPATIGAAVESDPSLRQRRVTELAAAGASTAAAIQAGILTTLGTQVINPVTGTAGDVQSCTVLFNDTDSYDANNNPPHSFEVIAQSATSAPGTGGAGTPDALLAAEIYALKAAGDRAVGISSNQIVYDSQGNPHAIGFTRPAIIDVWVSIVVAHIPGSSVLPATADVVAAIAAYGPVVGGAIVIERIKALALAVPNVYDIPYCTIGTSASPTGTSNLPGNIRQIYRIQYGNVSATVS